MVHLRMRARGNIFRFQVSADGMVWRTVGRTFRGPDLRVGPHRR